MKKKCILTLWVIGVAALQGHAQSIGPSTLNASGGSASVAGNLYEWSVGEMTMISTFSSSGLVVTQGLLQPSATGGTGVGNSPQITQHLDVFPNPADYILYLNPRFRGPVTLQYSLLDMTGRTVLSQKAFLPTGTEKQSLLLSHLAAGQYMLSVVLDDQGDHYNAAYKIQKY